MKVLIVQDDVGARRLVEFTLQQEGIEVVTAANGLEALERAQVEQPDVIVMDVVMPVMAGFETCLRLKEIPTTSHIPILLLTAEGEETNRDYGLLAGADECLMKPAPPQVVAEHIRKLVAQVNGGEQL